jgi:hypothetical protein
MNQKIILLFCLILFIPLASGYEPIPLIGYFYDSAEEVKVHIGDDIDTELTPSDPDTLSYTKTFPMYNDIRRQEVRLVLTVVNVLPCGAKDEDVYNDLVYINGITIAKLNDHIGGTEQDYIPQQVELIFSSDLIHKGDNNLTVTSGANLDGTNYDDFVLESVYMEQYGGLRHWLFSRISPDTVILLMVGIFIILAGSGYYLNRVQKLPVMYQFLLAGALGAILGMISSIMTQDSLFGLFMLVILPYVIMTFLGGLLVLAAWKYLLHRNLEPVWFILIIRLLVFLILTVVFFICVEAVQQLGCYLPPTLLFKTLNNLFLESHHLANLLDKQ